MAVVGNATVVVRALVDQMRSDLQRGFKNAERDADKSGDKAGESWASRFSDRAAGLDAAVGNRLSGLGRGANSAGDAAGGSFVSRFSDRLRSLDTAVIARMQGLGNSGAAGGDSAGEGFASRFSARLYNLDTSFLDRIRGLRGSAGTEGDASGASFSQRFLDRMRGIDDRALEFLRGLRSRSGSEGDDAGSSFGSAFASALRGNRSRAENELGSQGNAAGSKFRDALTRSVSGMRLDLPDFGGRLGMKILAVLPIIGVLGGAIAALGGGFVGLAGVVAQAAGALAGLPGILMGVAGAAIAGVVAFGGIGAAVKSLGQAQASAGGNAIKAARQQQTAAKATEGVARAQQQAARQIEAAQEQVVAAHERVAEAAERVRDAEKALGRDRADVARNNASATRNVESAERAYVDALREEKEAQADLTRARADALETFEDLAFAARDSTLDVTAATLRLEDAREQLATVKQNSAITDRERQQAQLDYDRAQLAYEEAIDHQQDAAKAQADAVAGGVEGLDTVVSAAQRAKDAAQAVEDAAQARDDAEADRVRTQQDGNQRIADSLKAVEDANKGVTDANKDLARAVRDLRYAQDDAARSIRDAKTAAQNANTSLGALGGTALKTKNAFAGLSPEAAHFARYLYSLKGNMEDLRAAAGRELFPKLETAIGNLVTNLFPLLETVLQQAGSSLGDFAITISNTLTAPDFKKKFGSFFDQFYTGVDDLAKGMDNGVSPAQDLYNSVGNIITAVVGLSEAALPLIDRFTNWISIITGGWADKTTGNTDGLTNSLNKAGDAAALIGSVFGNTFGALWQIMKVGRDVGMQLWQELDNGAESWKNWTKSGEGTKRIAEFFEKIKPNVEAVGRFVKDLVVEFVHLGENPDVGSAFDALREALPDVSDLINTFTKLAPSLIHLLHEIIDAFQAVSDSPAFEIFIRVLTDAFSVLGAIISTPIGTILGVFLAVAAGLKAISLFTKLTGLQYLAGLFAKGIFLKGENAQGLRGFGAALKGVKDESSALSDVIGTSLGNKFRDLRGGADDGTGAVRKLSAQIADLDSALDKIDLDDLESFEGVNDDALVDIRERLQQIDTELRGMPDADIKSNPAQVRAAQEEVQSLVRELKDISSTAIAAPHIDWDDLDDDGRRMVTQMATGMRSELVKVQSAADDVAQTVSDYLEQHSPARRGPLSGVGTEGWGERAGVNFAAGLEDSTAKVRDAASDVARAAERELSDIHSNVSVDVDTPRSHGDNDDRGGRAKDAVGDAAGDAIQDAMSGNFDPKAMGLAFAGDLASSMTEGLVDKAGNIMGALKGKLTGAGATVASDVGTNIGSSVGSSAAGGVAGSGGKIAGAFGKVGGAISGAARGIGLAMSTALGPVGLIIIAIAALVAGFIYAYNHSETFRNIVDGALRAVADAAQWLWDKAQAVFGWLKDNWPLLLGVFLGPFGLALGLIIKFWDDIKNAATLVWDHIKTGFDSLVAFFTGLPLRIAIIAATLWISVQDKATAIKDAVVLKFNELVTFVTGLPARISEIARNLWNSISTKADEIKQAAVGKFNSLITFVSELPARIASTARNMWNSISEKAHDVKEGVKSKFNDMITFFTGMPARISGALRNMFGGLRDGARDAINYVIGKWNGLSLTLGGGQIPLPFGQSVSIPSITLNTPDIPYLAKGATVLPRVGGTLARLAEAGRAETVVDTGQMNRMINLVNARLASERTTARGSGGPIILQKGAVTMHITNPVGETTEQTLNTRLRSMADLGVIERLIVEN